MPLLLGILRRRCPRMSRLYPVRSDITAKKRLHIGLGLKVKAPYRLMIRNDAFVDKLCTIECGGRTWGGIRITNPVGVEAWRDHGFPVVRVSMGRALWIRRKYKEKWAAIRSNWIVIASGVWTGFRWIVPDAMAVGPSAVVTIGTVITQVIRNSATPGPSQHGDIGIEFAGSRKMIGNLIDGFGYCAIVYNNEFAARDNSFVVANLPKVLDYNQHYGGVTTNVVGQGAKPFPWPRRGVWS